ncbi:glutathione S-transferase [Inquilinus ginsengisoli]|jgi:glutathione S-transferase|uniref:Glutathione S-transferase n=1 Tax=Inquilinus ginsengisoli TaxID=363840 RepID=A0ABU1JVI2_9PROT|nr:glutathione S-transferase family protein [Inquilinus ginsengisoli]MDR6292629.1 glutathione S-transferase [Inquilinus ginsengisoli]
MRVRTLKLYHYPAVRSARVKWLLHELVGDAFELEVVDLYEGEQYSPRYLDINPNHGVPALEIVTEDGRSTRMLESGAMVVVLADSFPEKGLAPVPDGFSPERADYLQAIHFCGAAMDMMLWQIRIHEHILPDRERDDRTIQRYRHKFAGEVEPQLKRQLEAGGFACGGRFSAADCVIGHGVMWARAYQLCGDPVFADYIARLSQRPAFQSAFADLGGFTLAVPRDAPVVELLTG